MASTREWDRGKEWGEGGSYGYTRGREEAVDNHGDGKRRKYNNGGYEDSSWPPYNQKSGNEYDTYERGDQYDTYDRPHRQGSGIVNRKKHIVSEPSPHVIFLGLDPDFTEADLFSFLKSQGSVPESATIIRERNTGASKGFGFAQFNTAEDARHFVEPNFPFISIPPPASHGASAAAAFRAAVDAGVHHNGRRVKIDYSLSANLSEKGRRGPQHSNDGTRDIGNTQAPVLLFRGLDPLSGTAAIDQSLQGSSGPGSGGAKGVKRIILIKDKVTHASWGFVFVEFIDIQAASAVLAATMSPSLHPNGFRISDRPVAASFAHPYSFQPIPDNIYPDESCLKSSLNLGGLEDAWVRYWDESSTVSVLEFEVEESVEKAVSLKAKKEKKKPKASTDKQPAVSIEASVLPPLSKPVTLNFGKASASSSKPPGTFAKVPLAQLGFSGLDENGPDDNKSNEERPTAVEDSKAQSSQRVAPMIASKKVVNNISKWNHVKDDLAGNQPSTSDEITSASVSTCFEREADFAFSDTEGKSCLLCSRQFKSLDQLHRHNKESDLHKKNYKDVSLREVAREKAAVSRRREEPLPADQSAASKYRDRASERRILHNQPDIPVDQNTSNGSEIMKVRYAEAPPAPAPTPPTPIAPAKDESNIGNKLLKMMGWTEGTGLGLEGEGRVDPIEAAIYASGAGLGASKGKDVSKYTEGISGYLNMAKDSARDRYDS